MYVGRYINLDRNAARRAQIEENLRQARVADRYRRFAGVDGSEAIQSHPTSLAPGFLGNWLSHESVLAEHDNPAAHLHILEDDASLPSGAAPLLDAILARADAEIPDWDLLFTDTIPPIDTKAHLALAEHVLTYPQTRRIGLVSLAEMDFAGMASYFVNRRSIAKYADLIRGHWTAGLPIDIYLREQARSAGRINVYVTVPFITTVSPASSDSDVTGKHDWGHNVLELFRRAHYMDADHSAILAQLQKLTQGACRPAFANIFLLVQAGAFSDRWTGV